MYIHRITLLMILFEFSQYFFQCEIKPNVEIFLIFPPILIFMNDGKKKFRKFVRKLAQSILSNCRLMLEHLFIYLIGYCIYLIEYPRFT